jgi:predicted DsbA family dithiol-disulfide isomerase
MSSRSDSKQAAREERLAAEQEAAGKARKQRVWALVGGATLFAAVVVVVLIVISSGGSESSVEISGDAAQFDGIPQKGIELGAPDAPVTLTEFADPQCPFCMKYTADVMPGLIQKYVKAGDLRMELNLLTFIGPDSESLARAAYAASEQNGMWQWMDIAYARQGQENSGYVDSAFIDAISESAGLDVKQVNADSGSEAVTTQLSGANAAAQSAGIQSTPGFQVGPTGGDLQTVDQADLDKAINDQLAAAK